MSFLTNLTTEKNNTTYCPVRVMAVVGFTVGLGLEVYGTVTGKPFDFQGFGVGLGAALSTLAVTLGMKSKTESDPQ